MAPSPLPCSPALRRFKQIDPEVRLVKLMCRPYQYHGCEDVYREEGTRDDEVYAHACGGLCPVYPRKRER